MFKIVYRNCAGIDIHKKTIIAIARLLFISIYHILNNGEVFGYERFDNLFNRNLKSPQKVKIRLKK